MTDQEKAATFIGWREGQPCSHRELCDGSMWGCGIRECVACHCRIPIDAVHCKHFDAAPDMSDPRNYMKALEGLAVRGYFYSITDVECSVGRFDHNTRRLLLDLQARGEGKALKALAALWDAEEAARSKGAA